MSFPGVEGELLVVHGVRVELREGVGGGAKRRVEGSIHLVEAGGDRLSLLRHRKIGF